MQSLAPFFPTVLDRFKVLSRVTTSLTEVGGQAVLGRQNILPTPWLTERHGYDPTSAYRQQVYHFIELPIR